MQPQSERYTFCSYTLFRWQCEKVSPEVAARLKPKKKKNKVNMSIVLHRDCRGRSLESKKKKKNLFTFIS